MFIYMSKKIAIPKQSSVSCLSWNHSSGYIAVGGDDGMLKVLKLESDADDARPSTSHEDV